MSQNVRRSPWRAVFAAIIVWAIANAAAAQSSGNRPANEDQKVARAVRITKPPVIDGRLDDKVWMQAEVIEDLHEILPIEYNPPSQRTEIYVLYDADALYIGARMWETDPRGITARILQQREFLNGDDHLAIILDPFNNHRSGYTFVINANGVRVDGIYLSTTSNNFDWDGIHAGAAARFEHGWTAEVMIPFKTLSFDPANDTWGINFFRVIARDNERIGWVSRNRSQNPAITGRLVGLSGLKQGLGLDVVPSLMAHYSGTVRPQLDAYYKITPALNSAITINTDFSATEVDDRQVNLTRFNLFFPEKRSFFLRELDIFEFGGSTAFNNNLNTAATSASVQNGRPFFSRSVGLGAAGQPVDLDVGAKVSGRIGRWDVGALSVHQGADASAPASALFVGRATVNVLSESKLGVIVSGGDPRSPFDSTLVGSDFQFMNSRFRGNKTLQAEGWFQASRSNRAGASGEAFGLGLHVPSQNGWRGELAFKQLGAGFNPALGFVSQNGIRESTADVGYTYRLRDRFVRSIFGGVDVDRIDLMHGGLESQVVSVRALELQDQLSDTLLVRYIVDEERLPAPFSIAGVTIPSGVYTFGQTLLQADTGLQRRVAAGVTYRAGAFYGGDRTDLGGRLTLRPSKHVREALAYTITDARLPYGRFITRLITSKTDLVISNQISWISLVQYDNVSNIVGINSRVHWTPRDGREVFLVWNQNYHDVDRAGAFRSVYSDTVLKVNYTFRF